jgi:hypothetical protein
MTQSMSAIIPGSSPFTSASHRARRRTDLTPTLPSHHPLNPRATGGPSMMETSYHGSTASSVRAHSAATPSGGARKPPGRAVSLSRLDQLSQPRRGRLATAAAPQGGSKKPQNLGTEESAPSKSMSKSMCHLAAGSAGKQRAPRSPAAAAPRPLNRAPADGGAGGVARSMTHLPGSGSAPPVVRMTRAERLRLMRVSGSADKSSATTAPASSRTLLVSG